MDPALFLRSVLATLCSLRLVAVGAAILQLRGTALIVWGLTLKQSESASEGRMDGSELPFGVIEHHRPRILFWGTWLLLLCLALQVVAAVLP